MDAGLRGLVEHKPLGQVLEEERHTAADLWDRREATMGRPSQALTHYTALVREAELTKQVKALQLELRMLQRELDTLTGDNAKPSPGHRIFRSPLGESSVLIEYDFGTEDDGRDSSYLCVLVNGRWIDAEDEFADHVVERWREEADAHMKSEQVAE